MSGAVRVVRTLSPVRPSVKQVRGRETLAQQGQTSAVAGAVDLVAEFVRIPSICAPLRKSHDFRYEFMFVNAGKIETQMRYELRALGPACGRRRPETLQLV